MNLKKILILFLAVILVLLTIWVLPFLFLVTDLINAYTDQGSVAVQTNHGIVQCRIYKASGKPYVLIGPYPFQKQKDFLFVTKNEVVGRMLDDKVKNDYIIFYKWLFIDFDLSSNLDSMAPCFTFDAEIKYNKKKSKFSYGIYLESPQKTQSKVSFLIDENLL